MNERASPERVAERLLWLQGQLGFEKQKDFAAALGASESRFNNWAKGKQLMPLGPALLLQERYGVPLDFIYLAEIDRLPSKLARAWLSQPRV